jgi:hypothetical protein
VTGVRVAIVLAAGQNAFFVELATAIASGLQRLGVDTEVLTGRLPEPHPDVVPLFLPPHEVAALGGRAALEDPVLLARSIAVCAEQPGSSWFFDNLPLVRGMGAVFDLSDQGVRSLAQQGISALRLDLGHVPEWDGRDADLHAGRDLDVVFLGCSTSRRHRLLAACAPVLVGREVCLVLSDNATPNPTTGAGFVSGDDKRALLRRARVVLNLHRDDEHQGQPYMEWLRVMDVLHAGAVLVTEPATDLRDLEPGRHLVVSRTSSLPSVLAAALDDDEGLRRMREQATAWLRERPFSQALEVVAEKARELAGRPLPAPPLAFEAVTVQAPPPPAVHGTDPTSVALKRSVLEGISLRRRVAELERRVSGFSTDLEVVSVSPAWSGPDRQVAVIVPTFRHAAVIADTLASVLPDRYAGLEVVVVDDGSPEDDARVATDLSRQHPDLAMLVVRHPVNRGLGAARNTGVGVATADHLLMLDADNELLPGTVQRLHGALCAAPDAPLAYGILATWNPLAGPVGLISQFPWRTEVLVEQNYVDALAMVRRSTLDRLGGYTEELSLYGWEDYDLWLGVADLGLVPAFVPHVVARYRVEPTSMLSVTNISHADAFARLHQRHPVMAVAR